MQWNHGSDRAAERELRLHGACFRLASARRERRRRHRRGRRSLTMESVGQPWLLCAEVSFSSRAMVLDIIIGLVGEGQFRRTDAALTSRPAAVHPFHVILKSASKP